MKREEENTCITGKKSPPKNTHIPKIYIKNKTIRTEHRPGTLSKTLKKKTGAHQCKNKNREN